MDRLLLAACLLGFCAVVQSQSSVWKGFRAANAAQQNPKQYSRSGEDVLIECRTGKSGTFSAFTWGENNQEGVNYQTVFLGGSKYKAQLFNVVPDTSTPGLIKYNCDGDCGVDLLVKNVTAVDSGKYRCEFGEFLENGEGQRNIQETELSVLEEPSGYKFQTEYNSSETNYEGNETVILREGSAMNVSCIVENSWPPANVSFTMVSPNQGEYDFSTQIEEVTDGTKQFTKNTKVTVELNPNKAWESITCEVTMDHTDFVTQNVQMNVNVHYPPSGTPKLSVVDEAPTTTVNGIPQYDWKIGQVVKMKCEMSGGDRGMPKGRIYLTYDLGNGHVRMPEEHYTTSNTSDDITYTVADYTGIYSCEVKSPEYPVLFVGNELDEIKVQALPADTTTKSGLDDATIAAVVVVSILVFVIAVGVIGYVVYRRRRQPGLPPTTTSTTAPPTVSNPVQKSGGKPSPPSSAPPPENRDVEAATGGRRGEPGSHPMTEVNLDEGNAA